MLMLGILGAYLGRGWLQERGEGQTSDIPEADRFNYQLPLANERGDWTRQRTAEVEAREAPQVGESSFRGDQQALVDRLRGQMSGQDSLAQLQLRNATDANIAQQRSLAASAGPQNQAMMQRLAAQNIGRMNQGVGQQAAMLGIQERNAAANALGQVAQGARGQDLQRGQFNAGAQMQQTGLNDQYAMGLRGLEMGNAGLVQRGNMGYAQDLTTRRGQDLGQPLQPQNWERIAGVAAPIAGAALMSDERLKTNVQRPDESELDQLIAYLKPQKYEYKDQRLGDGQRLGVMAQDVERGGPAGQALVSEQGGAKALDVPKSLGTALGLIGRLGERVDQMQKQAGGGEEPRVAGDVYMHQPEARPDPREIRAQTQPPKAPAPPAQWFPEGREQNQAYSTGLEHSGWMRQNPGKEIPGMFEAGPSQAAWLAYLRGLGVQ